MKSAIKIFLTVFMVLVFPIISYAGQWQQDTSGWRYVNDDGSHQVGWLQDIDGKWYYIDAESGYMLSNTTTPDGYTVAENGEWVEGDATTLKKIMAMTIKLNLQQLLMKIQ